MIPLLETFRKAGRLDVLLDFFAEREVPGSLSSYVVGNLLQESLGDDRLRDRAIDVFRKYWKANPAYQMTLLSYINSDLIWRLPEMYDLAHPAILSRNPALASVYAQWEMFETHGLGPRRHGSGTAAEPGDALLDLADSRGQLDDLAAAVESARKSRSGWPAADFYRAMIACRAGRYDEARALVRKLANPKTRDDSLMSSIYPFFAFMAVGGELEAHPATTDDAIVLYEWATSLPYSPTFVRYGLEQHPISRLIRLHERAGPDRRRTPRRARLRPEPGSLHGARGTQQAVQDLFHTGDGAEARRPGLCRRRGHPLQRGAPPRRADPARQLELLSGFAAIPQTDPGGPRIHPGRPDLRRAGPDRGPIDRRRIRSPTGRAVRRG